ncbi:MULTISPECIES: hypothetical protein [unclassified Mycobacterium]|uniref:hypothetical protein n=1 Tax=unclassified Mycobacterium TaxID=2642494 RepID=UPI000800E593|nr:MULTISPECIES: hypothetical protein [unclassified Mycobacterium]OBG51627.1 hypothetical protein A5704_05405 [Mycobacterium sp. E735]OBG66152.1 hypothetical protein A5703_14145 [Mycobacterium sp. E188]OBG70700.1 hypothetical protein A5701_02875 [Mycobacterium sp. E3305]OBG90815.1 hypothetical protein A9X05_12110 [Mycobacterium sp. E3298]OBH40745.1 hypothetical protein A5691_20390 [Mycobacterium sp. E183]
MRTVAEKNTDKKIGYIRLGIVSAVIAALIGLGLALIAANKPAAGHPCSMRNVTSKDASGHMVSCDRATASKRDLVWQLAPAS